MKPFRRISISHYARSPGWLSFLLPLSWCYGLGVFFRLLAYRWGLLPVVRAGVPVISIGNLTTGGTGKTPVVMALAQLLCRAGRKVVILVRGYGATEPIAYGIPRSPAQGDEACWLQKALPEVTVIVGKDRAHNAQRAVAEFKPDVILLDDGYQHLRLHRDVNILLMDGYQMIGNGHLLPVGPLREPLSEIRRADAVWVTKTRRSAYLERVEGWRDRYGRRPDVPVNTLRFEVEGYQSLKDGTLLPPEALRDEKVLAFSGIAQPFIFETDLRGTGVFLAGHLCFPDHHVYKASDMEAVLKDWTPPTRLVTTEKDRIKVEAFLPEAVKSYTYTLIVRPVLEMAILPPQLQELLNAFPEQERHVIAGP